MANLRPMAENALCNSSPGQTGENVKVTAFPSSRTILRAIRSDQPDPLEICRHWIWTTSHCDMFAENFCVFFLAAFQPVTITIKSSQTAEYAHFTSSLLS